METVATMSATVDDYIHHTQEQGGIGAGPYLQPDVCPGGKGGWPGVNYNKVLHVV